MKLASRQRPENMMSAQYPTAPIQTVCKAVCDSIQRLRIPHVQTQLKAVATGSVIDALDVETVSNVLLPMVPKPSRDRLGETATEAWEAVGRSLQIQEMLVREIEALVRAGYERLNSSA